MLVRRSAILFFETRESVELDLAALFSGTGVLQADQYWVALAPHLGQELELSQPELAALGAIGPTLWQEFGPCALRFGAPLMTGLIERGLLVSDDPAHAVLRARDDLLRAGHWRPISALAHVFSRWQDVQGENGKRFPTFNDLVDAYGLPPAASIECGPADAALDLPPAPAGALDGVLLQRYTGRNYDTAAVLPLALAARLLQRCFGAQQQREMMEGAEALKKTSPSGGGLHPIEAYVLVQRIEGVPCGLYHYHPLRHALEPLRALQPQAARQLALESVAHQDWFADAPMLVVLAGRVARSFWKYREHAKAYRVLTLDAGHLSQTFYLLAAEAGMPAFITAGINEANIEQAFGLDPLRDAVLAVLGCGPAATVSTTVEFRPWV
jgi:putative peptide maturation dehydrogenase